MSATLAFTPEAVRDTLLAAGFTEYTSGLDGNPGFEIGDGRDRTGEIVVGYRTGRAYKRDGDDEKRMRHEEAYEAALGRAGYRAHIDMQYVIVTGTED